MKVVQYLIKQLLHLEYFTKYRSDGNLYVATWKQIFGKPYDIHYYKVYAQKI